MHYRSSVTMAAVISGNGLGLGVSTWAELGGGAQGSSGIARLRDGIFVNVANGNLVTQGQDESFLGQGLQTSLIRTYNSAAGLGVAGADGWQLSLDRRLEVVGSPATQVRRILGDGSEQVFTWSATRQAFVAGYLPPEHVSCRRNRWLDWFRFGGDERRERREQRED